MSTIIKQLRNILESLSMKELRDSHQVFIDIFEDKGICISCGCLVKYCICACDME